MSHTHDRDANILGAFAVAVADRVRAPSAEAALMALHTWLAGASIDGLARVLALSHSGAVRLVDRLAADGLLERRASADGRTASLHLTERGDAEAARLQERRTAALQEVLAPLSAAEQQVMTELLERLLAPFVPDRAAARHLCRMCDPDACGHPERCPVTLAVPH